MGQRMQCEIAASFLHNPKIIFLDEPTIGLDVFNKEIITNILNTMKKTSDVTLILTTHDLEDMCKICDRAIVINNGEVLLEKDIDLLLYLNNQQKRIVFTTENESAPPITFEKDIKVSYEPHKIICEHVEREVVQEVITTVTKQCFILDLSIEESNFTDIIKSYLKRQA